MTRRRRAEHALVLPLDAQHQAERHEQSKTRPALAMDWLAWLRTIPIVLSFMFFPVTCGAVAGPHSMFASTGVNHSGHFIHIHPTSAGVALSQNSRVANGNAQRASDFPEQMQVSVGFVAKLEETDGLLPNIAGSVQIRALFDPLGSDAHQLEPPPPRGF